MKIRIFAVAAMAAACTVSAANDVDAAKFGLKASPGYPIQFCLTGDRGTYFFTENYTSLKPGWHPIYLYRGQLGESGERVGYWQMTIEGTVIATSDTGSTVIYGHETQPCGYVRPH